MASPTSTFSDDVDASRRASDPPKTSPDAGRMCLVCNDRANGYNFGVLTCESCKAFFRRNAAKEDIIKCPFSNSCQITSASRKFCQACRLNKCFSVGMNSNWLSETKKPRPGKVKRKKVDEEERNNSNEGQEEKVSVSKAFLQKLMKQANERKCCVCTCSCGYYPTGTRLTAASSPPTHSSSVSDVSVMSPAGSSLVGSSPVSPLGMLSIHPSSPRVPSSSSSNFFNIPSNSYLSPHAPPPAGYCSSPAGMIQASPHISAFHPPFPYANQHFSAIHFSPHIRNGILDIPSSPLPNSAFSPVQFISPTVFDPTAAIPTVPSIVQMTSAREAASRKTDPTEPISVELMVAIIGKRIEKYAKVLTTEEMGLMEELHLINEPLNTPLEKDYTSESLQEVIRIVEEALTRIISMAASLKAFQELDIEDRKQLVKSGFCELLIVRGVMAYNKTNESWNHGFATTKMEVKVEILKQDPKMKIHYEQHKKLLDSFGEEIRTNYNIMLIFNAIVIFHPHVSNLKDSAKVHATQAKYFALLLKVLNYEFPKEKADESYKKLLNLVIDLHRVNQTMLHLFYGLDPTQLDPLVKELCNFK